HKAQLIKYLFKYITKGLDCSIVVTVTTQEDIFSSSNEAVTPVDEISQYLDCRLTSSYEAVWCLFKFPIHERNPKVVCLCVHMPNKQPISFDPNQSVHSIVASPGLTNTMLS
ncbi:hypothetical protein LINPERPRIM_LOCUS20753, partial [Linum perenne]